MFLALVMAPLSQKMSCEEQKKNNERVGESINMPTRETNERIKRTGTRNK